jgi:NAD(P)-dependent dehydrogenase (short-subunit alcohol dehydrogenase family)
MPDPRETASAARSGTPRRAGARGLVTGAASGIGRAVAERMLADGVATTAVDVDLRGLAELAGRGATTLAADLTDPAERSRVVESGHGCDYLVNAAGVIRLTPIDRVTVDEWRAVHAVNAEALFFLVQAIGPTMAPGGAIVNLSSTSAKTGTTLEAAVYASTKAAVLSLTRSFGCWLAPRGVRVNAVVPGIVDTPMQDRVLDEVAALRGVTRARLERDRLRGVWLGRSASPEECAALVSFLLSDDAAYMTGQGVNFSGGLVTW